MFEWMGFLFILNQRFLFIGRVLISTAHPIRFLVKGVNCIRTADFITEAKVLEILEVQGRGRGFNWNPNFRNCKH